MTTFKLFFGDEDIRRITLEDVGTWESFQQHLVELYPDRYHPELRVTYKDEEGDSINITCQREWEAMLDTLKGQNTIRLHLSEGSNSGQYFKDGPPPVIHEVYAQNNSEDDRVVLEVTASEALRTLTLQVPKCLERLLPSGKLLPTNIPSWLEPFVELRRVPESGPEPAVDLDIDVCGLFEALHQQALARIGPDRPSAVVKKAKDFLQSMIDLIPDHPLANYNLACAQSLLGEVKDSAESLRRAVSGGFNNLKHMLQDTDLVNLREQASSEFNDIVAALKQRLGVDEEEGESEAKEKEVEEVEMVEIPSKEDRGLDESQALEDQEWVKVEKPAVEAVVEKRGVDDDEVVLPAGESVPVAAASPAPRRETRWAKQQEALATMGFSNFDVNEVLLNDAKGDLVRVVNALLCQ